MQLHLTVSCISLYIAQLKHVVNRFFFCFLFILIIVRFANLSVYATFLESKIVIRSSKVRKNGTSLIRLSASKWVNSVISSFMFNLTYFCSGKLMYITQLLGYIVVCYSKNIYLMFNFLANDFSMTLFGHDMSEHKITLLDKSCQVKRSFG